MNSLIDEKIATIFNATQKPFQKILVRIECPLDSGIKAECWRICEQEKNSQAIPGGVRPFFQFVEAVHKAEPKRIFNVIEFCIDQTGKYSTSFSYDEEVQKQAEENIKQE